MTKWAITIWVDRYPKAPVICDGHGCSEQVDVALAVPVRHAEFAQEERQRMSRGKAQAEWYDPSEEALDALGWFCGGAYYCPECRQRKDSGYREFLQE